MKILMMIERDTIRNRIPIRGLTKTQKRNAQGCSIGRIPQLALQSRLRDLHILLSKLKDTLPHVMSENAAPLLQLQLTTLLE